MRNSLFGFLLGIGCMVLFFVLQSSKGVPATAGSVQSNTTAGDDRILPQIVKSPSLDGNYSFAGEPLDMENFDVRERLERELLRNTYFHSNTVLILKRSRRYFPIIERILAEEGLPDDLKYIAVTESDLTNAKSPAGAKGLWQFMPAVARSFKLEVNSEVDERNHVEKATRAACTHLQNYQKQFGSWQLATAAYNMGEGNLRKYLREQQAELYEDMNINDETMRYLYRIVSMKSIMENPSDFGFYLGDEDYYAPLENYRVETITSSIPNLATYANEQGISYRQLKIYNPWLISTKLTLSGNKTYSFYIPQ